MSPDRAASVRVRLLRIAKAKNEEFERLLVRYALERLLFRLGSSSDSDQFVLKGALLFWLWERELPRPTRDADLLCRGDASGNRLAEVFRRLCEMPGDDGLLLEPASVRVEPIRETEEYQGTRILLLARLGSARIKIQVDVGTGDAVTPAPQAALLPTLLDQPAPRLLVYPRETVVAEKLQAVVRFGVRNSRLKDYFDLDHLAQHYAFDGGVLASAIRGTFERRQTVLPDGVPPGLADAFAEDPGRIRQWQALVDKTALGGADASLDRLLERTRAFLMPPLRAAGADDRFSRRWPAGGPWE